MLRRVMARVGLSVLACGLVPLLAWAAGTGKQGMVLTKDHHTYIGEVDETSIPDKIQITSGPAQKIEIYRQNVEKVTYFNTPAEEFNGRLSALDRKDVAARLDLANFAIAHNMYPQARELLVAALALEPGNRNATDLLHKVDEQIKASHPPETKPAGPAQADLPPVRPGLVRARRTLTPDEINFIRQTEWTENDQDIKVQVTGEARKGAIDLGSIDPNAISKMSPADIGWQIVRHGPPGLRKDVKVASDPGSLASYRKVHRLIISTCATGACHNTEKGGKFFLFTDPQTDATILTDYLILQQFSTTINGVEHEMIDRLHPEGSLLTQFALPPALADFPHPKAAGYLAPTKTPFALNQIKQWIADLPAVAPSYNIDLSVPPPKPEGATTRPAR